MSHKHKAIPTPKAKEPSNSEHLQESLENLKALMVDPHANSLLIEQELTRASGLAAAL